MRYFEFKPLSVRFLTLTSVFIASAVLSFSSHAVSISAYRIYLDAENRSSSFVIFNREVESQECSLKLRHYNFDDASQMSKYEGDTLPDNSAKEWIQYSPRKFVLTPAHSQTVRFTLRRKANATDGEYRSYLVIDCGAELAAGADARTESLVSIKPKLMHNVPIIARVGELDAKVSIEDIQVKEKGLAFVIKRTGSRSIYGDIELVNKRTNKVVSFQKGFSIYPESSKYAFVLSREGVDAADLKIRFVENENYGGDIVLEKSVIGM